MDWKKETEPALEEIRELIKKSGLSQRHYEERIGFSKGYISQLLAKNLDLKLWHVLALLKALEQSPGDFFARVYPKETTDALAEFQNASEPVTEEVDEALGRLYKYGVESLKELRGRLARCEEAVTQLEDRGLLEKARRKREV